MRGWVLEGGTAKETNTFEGIAAAHAEKKNIWVELEDHCAISERLLRETFAIHPLVIEDVWSERQLPKIIDYTGYLQIIAHSVLKTSTPDSLKISELDLLLGPNYIITHTHGDCGELPPERIPVLLSRGPAWLAHDLLDGLVDDYLPLIDCYDDEISALEAEVVAKAGTPAGQPLVTRIFPLQRGLQPIRRTSIHQREVLLRLSRAEFDEIPREAAPYFRDIYDHFARVTDLADSYRELLSSLLEGYWSVQSNRMNEIMKTLTLMSTIMLPLTFIAGVYGMNFVHMPELQWRFGYPFALGLMLVVGVSIFVWFKLKRWV